MFHFCPYLIFHSLTQDTPASALQRKKSLPDVQCLPVVTKSQGSKEMTREEISVLSSSRRENLRKQLEEIERYKSNPLLYILNPRTTVSHLFNLTFHPLFSTLLFRNGCPVNGWSLSFCSLTCPWRLCFLSYWHEESFYFPGRNLMSMEPRWILNLLLFVYPKSF